MRPVLVWGNCQAAPVAALLRAPLATVGLEVVETPPVYLLDEVDLDRARRQAVQAAVLISQPVSDDYRLAGCGTAAMSALLPADARTLRFGVAHHVGAFPYQTNAHGADGTRVLAPVTDYHDLRAVVAAQRGMSIEHALEWWPQPSPQTVRTIADAATAELRRREQPLDVRVADRLLEPDAMWTMTHPSNTILAAVARQLLDLLDVPQRVEVAAREFLGQRRAPVEPAVAAALGWPLSQRMHWVVDGQERQLEDVLAEQLPFYARRHDVVADTMARQRARLEQFGL